MALNFKEIEYVLDELSSRIIGSTVVGVAELPLYALILYLEQPDSGNILRVLISCNDRFSRIHLLTKRIKVPKPPLPFGALADKHINGSILETISQKPNDRVIRIGFSSGNSLIAELTGVHANLFLLDENDVILGMLRANRSKLRNLRTGHSYEPVFDRADAADTKIESNIERMDGESFNEAVERTYSLLELDAERSRVQNAIARAIRRKIQKLSKAIDAVRSDLERSENEQTLRSWADLLAANFHQIKKGMEKIVLVDFVSGEDVEIPLDPAMDARQNIERLYKRAKKLKRGKELSLARIRELESELDKLLAMQNEFEELSKEADGLDALTNWALQHGFSNAIEKTLRRGERAKTAQKSRQEERIEKICRVFRSADGFKILVGKNAAANDRLTFGLLKGNDLWLHASGTSGPHVGVVLPKEMDDIPNVALLDAATLAAKFAGFSAGDEVEVMYAKRKYVRKPGKRAAKGLVIVSKPRYIKILIEEDRLKRLLASRGV